MRHEFADGKYTVINDNGKLTALRHGEPWGRDLIGDNLVYWMLVEVDRLKAECDGWKADQKENLTNQVALQQEINALREAVAAFVEYDDGAESNDIDMMLVYHEAITLARAALGVAQ